MMPSDESVMARWLLSTPVLRLSAKNASFNRLGVMVEVSLIKPTSLVNWVFKPKPGVQPGLQLLNGSFSRVARVEETLADAVLFIHLVIDVGEHLVLSKGAWNAVGRKAEGAAVLLRDGGAWRRDEVAAVCILQVQQAQRDGVDVGSICS